MTARINDFSSRILFLNTNFLLLAVGYEETRSSGNGWMQVH